MKLLFVVPAFNEQASLAAVVNDLRRHYPDAKIAVVNDGSTDATAQVARSLGVQVLDLPYNLGIGGAVQTGLLFAAREDVDVVVQFDGDGQHRADQVTKLLAPLLRAECDVVTGSRFLEASDYLVSPGRRLGIAILRFVNSWLAHQPITDSTSGFRAYNRRAIAFLADDYPHDYPEPESIVTLCRRGFIVREVPVQMRSRQSGTSSITVLRSCYYMVKVLLAIGITTSRRVRRTTPRPEITEQTR